MDRLYTKNNYFETLELDFTTVTKKQIKKAYRKLAIQHHPDVSTAEDSEEKFIKITQAYKVLSDDTLRKKYLRCPEKMRSSEPQYNECKEFYSQLSEQTKEMNFLTLKQFNLLEEQNKIIHECSTKVVKGKLKEFCSFKMEYELNFFDPFSQPVVALTKKLETDFKDEMGPLEGLTLASILSTGLAFFGIIAETKTDTYTKLFLVHFVSKMMELKKYEMMSGVLTEDLNKKTKEEAAKKAFEEAEEAESNYQQTLNEEDKNSGKEDKQLVATGKVIDHKVPDKMNSKTEEKEETINTGFINNIKTDTHMFNGGRTELSYAAKDGDLEKVRQLIAEGANVNEPDRLFFEERSIESQRLPIYYSVEKNYPEISRALIDAGSITHIIAYDIAYDNQDNKWLKTFISLTSFALEKQQCDLTKELLDINEGMIFESMQEKHVVGGAHITHEQAKNLFKQDVFSVLTDFSMTLTSNHQESYPCGNETIDIKWEFNPELLAFEIYGVILNGLESQLALSEHQDL
jgi:curved DNA-binding protein CbpA